MNLSKFITLKEATKSRTAIRLGIENLPNEDQLKAMKLVATKIFDPCREFIGAPLGANSFLRVIPLNRAVGSSDSSQHPRGEAVDIDCDVYGNGTNKEVFDFIKDNLEFDQLIWEYGTEEEPAFVHCSFTDRYPNRKEILVAYVVNHRTKYKPY